MAILHKVFKVSRHIVYGYLIMEIYTTYKPDLEGFAIRHGIKYNVIEYKIFINAYFHGLPHKDLSK